MTWFLVIVFALPHAIILPKSFDSLDRCVKFLQTINTEDLPLMWCITAGPQQPESETEENQSHEAIKPEFSRRGI